MRQYMSKYSIIVAATDNNVIGRNNAMPWHLKRDLIRFKELTTGSAVIMGRRCFESIGKPLPNRLNVVVSSNESYNPEGVIVKPSLQFAVDYVNSKYIKEPFIIGGGSLYRQSVNIVNKIYLTRIHTEIPDGDTFFPELDMSKWDIVHSEDFPADKDNDFPTTFMILENKRYK